MADNVTLPATGTGTATPVIRTVQKGTPETQVVILDLGGSGTESLLTGTLPGGVFAPSMVKANVAASSTDTSLVAAASSQIVYVMGVIIVVGGTATDVTFNTKPGGAGTAITPLFAFPANGGMAVTPTGYALFQTASGEGLTVTTGTGSTVGILVQYVQV